MFGTLLYFDDQYLHHLASIGYRPFVEACIKADEKVEAIKYIPKLADPREKAEVF
jgi:hypothetical protein